MLQHALGIAKLKLTKFGGYLLAISLIGALIFVNLNLLAAKI
jgi:hypothetical protein